MLRAAAAANPSDGRAAYYLGNVLASKERGEEALAAWRDAVRLDPSNGVARRNLARALWLVAGKKDEAAAEYERAVAAAAEDFHLYVELDRLLADMNATPRRIRLLEGAPEAVRRRSPVVARPSMIARPLTTVVACVPGCTCRGSTEPTGYSTRLRRMPFSWSSM